MSKPITVEQGIKMIQFLQQMAGVNESYAVAKKGWENMSESERKLTVATYLHFNNMEELDK